MFIKRSNTMLLFKTRWIQKVPHFISVNFLIIVDSASPGTLIIYLQVLTTLFHTQSISFFLTQNPVFGIAYESFTHHHPAMFDVSQRRIPPLPGKYLNILLVLPAWSIWCEKWILFCWRTLHATRLIDVFCGCSNSLQNLFNSLSTSRTKKWMSQKSTPTKKIVLERLTWWADET